MILPAPSGKATTPEARGIRGPWNHARCVKPLVQGYAPVRQKSRGSSGDRFLCRLAAPIQLRLADTDAGRSAVVPTLLVKANRGISSSAGLPSGLLKLHVPLVSGNSQVPCKTGVS